MEKHSKNPIFNKICIIGVGLIGGSIGRAVKRHGLARWVIGVVRRDETAKKAVSLKAVDVAIKDLKEGVRGADLVILCGPVSTIESQLAFIKKRLSPNAIVIDVASSKRRIVEAARRHLKKNSFVGCHPMAGSEKTGVEHGCPYLFEKSVCFVTKAHPKVNRFWRALGATPVVISPEKHDDWAARASHLPHVLAFSIFQDLKSTVKLPLNPSLRSLGRLAKSDPALWADILLSNRTPMLRAIANFQKNLTSFKGALQKSAASALKRLIQKSNSHAA